MHILRMSLICQAPSTSQQPDLDATHKQACAEMNAAHEALEAAVSKDQNPFRTCENGEASSVESGEAAVKWQVGPGLGCSRLTAIFVSFTALNICFCVYTGDVEPAA